MTEGTLEPVGDRWRIRFRRRLAHPPDRVWRAITEPDELAAWFPQRVDAEWRVGARVRFSDPTMSMEFTGEVLRCEPPRLLEYTWGPDVLRFDIEPDGAGCTLSLADTFVEQGKAARDAAGWHVCLDSLVAALDGTEPGEPSEARWQAVHPAYVAGFGPEADTQGPPSS